MTKHQYNVWRKGWEEHHKPVLLKGTKDPIVIMGSPTGRKQDMIIEGHVVHSQHLLYPVGYKSIGWCAENFESLDSTTYNPISEYAINSNFAHDMKARGLSLKGVGLSSVNLLQEIKQKPIVIEVPLYSRKRRADREKAYCDKSSALAALIRHELAELSPNKTCYQITEKGRKYLAKVRRYLLKYFKDA